MLLVRHSCRSLQWKRVNWLQVRSMWLWNKPPTGIAKIEKLSLSFYCFNPQHLTKSKESKPIVITHGLYTSKEYFYEVASTLGKKLARPVYVIDLRNHGESPHRNFDGGATLMVLAQDVLNFMDEFSLNKTLLIGHGLGGRAMIQLAQLNNSRVDRVVTIDVSQDGPALYSRHLPRYLKYLDEMGLTTSNASLSYVRLAMKEILRSQVKNQWNLKLLLDNIRATTEGRYRWRFNTTTIESMLRNWTKVKQINYATQSNKSKMLNIVTKNNFISSEDYLDFKKTFGDCRVEYINSGLSHNYKNNLVKIIDKFANYNK